MATSKLSYRDNPKLKRVGVQVQWTREQIEEYQKCATDYLYFSKYVTIISLDNGIIPFDMYDFQKDMIKTFDENRFVIVKCPRQVGKTTTAITYLLWTVLFKSAQNIAILANKGKTANDILGKLQLAYESIPMWMQQGVVEWNKGRIELENKSVIISNSTSSSAARSGAYNIVFLDEFAFVPSNIAYDFITSVYPVITSGTNTKILMVSTPNGMNLFYKMWQDAVEKRSSYVPFEIHWSQVPGRDQDWREETIRNTSERQFQQEFETEFLGSSNTLISGGKLQQLTYKTPIAEHDKMKIYESPVKEDGEKNVKDHLYAIVVDPSEGKGLDSSAFSVVDISQTPYKQVATYKSSSISPILFPTVIYNAAKLYNDAYILVEINNTQQIADILHSDLEYENLWKVFTGNKKPQQLSAGFARGVQLGLKMSPQVKRIGCANLKALIEGDKLLINDFDTYSELTTFVAKRNSFAAEEDANDDLVMGLVMFSWLTTQKYFREIVNHDLRKQIQLENMNQFDELTPPAPVMDDGLAAEHEFMIEGGDLWEKADSNQPFASYHANFWRK
jgi:Terminase large subunit, T4likevirus-type, N-terminal/Terminase RNaseH-like domain